MVQFEITKSPDPNVRNHFRFMSNSLTIGKKTGDLIIADTELKESHVMIEVIGRDLLLHPQKDVEYFLINGKRATSIRKLKVGEEVTIGKTILKILGFEETTVQSKKNILNDKLAALVDSDSSRLSVIDKLSKLSK
jgi:hypothetical protein